MGIIETQLGRGQELETYAGVWMACSGIFTGFVVIRKSFSETLLTKILWFAGGLCLVLAMVLAGLYALRSIIPLEDLTIPTMQAIHGTLNALGFGTLILLGWAFRKVSPIIPPQ